MLRFLISIIISILFTIFFFYNRKKAILFLFLIKLPLDQFFWRIEVISLSSFSLKASEVFSLFITILCLLAIMMDKVNDPDRIGFLGSIPSVIRIPVTLFIVFFFLNIFYSKMHILALRQFTKFTTGFVIGAFVAKTLETEEDINWLLKCMLFSTITISILSIPTIYSGGQLQIYSESGTYLTGGVGPYYSADSFSSAFIVNLPPILLAYSILRSKLYKILSVFVILFIVIAVFVSAMRAIWISLTLVLILWIIANKKWKLLAVSTLFVFIIMSMRLFDNPIQKAYMKVKPDVEAIQTGDLSDRSFNARPFLWKTYFSSYMNSSLLDKIFGNDLVYIRALSIAGHDPHNDFLNILVRLGIIGLGITLILYIAVSYHLLKVFFKTESLYNWGLTLTAILSLIAMIIPSLTRTGLMNPNYEWVFWSFAFLALKRFMFEQNLILGFEESLVVDNSVEISN